MGSNSSPAPEMGGAKSPSSSPDARGPSSAGCTSDAAASSSAPRPSSPTTQDLLGGELSVVHGDPGLDTSARTSPTSTPLGPRPESPRDSTAAVVGSGRGGAKNPSSPTTRNLLDGELSVLLGDPGINTPARTSSTSTLLGPRHDSRRDSTAAVLGSERDGDSRAQSNYPSPTPTQRNQEALNAELFFPRGGTSSGFRPTPTPPQSASTAAYTVGERRDAQGGTEPFRRRPRFRESPSSVVGGELFFPRGPSFRDGSTTPNSTSTADGGTSFHFRRAPPQSASTAAYTVGGRRDAQGGTEPFRRRPRFRESPSSVVGGELVFPRGPSFRDASSTSNSTSTAVILWWPRHAQQGGSARNPDRRRRFTESPPTTAHVAGGGEIAGPSRFGQGALATPAEMRRSRWDVPSRNCHSCRLRPVAWFLSCCGFLLCEVCARSGGAAGCSCQVPRSRPVPFRPPFEPQPLRSLVFLRYPIWQMFYTGECHGLAVIAYYNAEDAFYEQAYGVRFHLDYFYMEGERWTRRIAVRFWLPSDDHMPLWMLVEVTDAQLPS